MKEALMKKELIVYYSNSGTAEKIALHMKKLIGADSDRIGYKGRNYKRHTMFSALFKVPATPKEIEGAEHNPSDYDRIILVFPIWAGAPAPVMRAYIKNNRAILGEKEYCMVCVSGGGSDNTLKWLKERGIKAPAEILHLKQKLVEVDDYNLTSII